MYNTLYEITRNSYLKNIFIFIPTAPPVNNINI